MTLGDLFSGAKLHLVSLLDCSLWKQEIGLVFLAIIPTKHSCFQTPSLGHVQAGSAAGGHWVSGHSLAGIKRTCVQHGPSQSCHLKVEGEARCNVSSKSSVAVEVLDTHQPSCSPWSLPGPVDCLQGRPYCQIGKHRITHNQVAQDKPKQMKL